MNGNILISGAGVTGLALAYWLDRAGFTTTLVDLTRQGPTPDDQMNAAKNGIDLTDLLDEVA
jgi:2-polyprenyl-6-methoxyphenol hydroxylase-like FAD-dependent oxidoreductase